MTLDGGIDTYSFKEKRYRSNVKPKGRKVIYINENGYDSDREYANKHLKQGAIYTIEEIWVGGSSSTVELEEFPNKQFNTVMFIDYKLF